MSNGCSNILNKLQEELLRLKEKTLEIELQNLSYQKQIIDLNNQLETNKHNFLQYFSNNSTPSYLWEQRKGNLELADYNFEAFEITKGNIKNILGINSTELYPLDDPVLYDLSKITTLKKRFTVDMFYQMRTINEKKYFSVKYDFLQPNLVCVQTTDKTIYKQTEQILLSLANKVALEQAVATEKPRYLLSNLVESILDGVLVASNNSKILYANKAAHDVLELTEKELLGNCYCKILFNSNNLILPFQPYQLNENHSKSYNVEFFTKSKKRLLLNIIIVSLREIHPYSSCLLIVFRALEKEKFSICTPCNSSQQQYSKPNNYIQDEQLTDREKEILLLLADGTTTKQLADNLFISTSTVRNHINSILRKLKVNTRIEAVAYARKNQLV